MPEDALNANSSIGLRKCRKCGQIKPLIEFSLHRSEKNEHRYICKTCVREYYRKWYIINRERVKEATRKWQTANPEKVREATRKWHIANAERGRDAARRANKKKYSTQEGKLNILMGKGIRNSLKAKKQGRHWEDLIGYTIQELKIRLKKTMPKDYTWKDLMNGKLHIDHIIPISVFNFERPENPDFKKCWSLMNLRLLPAKENQSKGAKLDRPFQPSLLI